MRIVEINSVNSGSTGNITIKIAEEARKNGIDIMTCVPKSRSNLKKSCENQFVFGDRMTRNLHIWLAQYTGFQECFSMIATYRLLRRITAFKPEIIHLHNLHGNYINLPMLFHYIKKKDIPIVWTLHDCWSFTGQCPHFIMVKCERWKYECFECPQIRIYPSSRVDRTREMWKLKRKWFTGVKNMTIVTPSKWLANLVQQSFLKDYPVKVINNGINLNVFKPTPSNFREKNGIEETKRLVLGVAFDWGIRKGLDVFIQLAKELDASKYQIVIVGTNDEIDRKIPNTIISVHRTQNQQELAAIYTAADVFVNPTREEVLGMVNVEALACGTPVLTFETGGCPEIVDDTCGKIIKVDDFESLKKDIVNILDAQVFSSEVCRKRALEFDETQLYHNYLELYKKVDNEDEE